MNIMSKDEMREAANTPRIKGAVRINHLSKPVQAYFFSETQRRNKEEFDAYDFSRMRDFPLKFEGKAFTEQCSIAPGQPIIPSGSWKDYVLVGTDPDVPPPFVGIEF